MWFTEIGFPSVEDGIGEDGQERCVLAFQQFEHVNVEAMFWFTVNDWCVPQAEMDAGKDRGLIGRDNRWKPAALAFDGGADYNGSTGGDMAYPANTMLPYWRLAVSDATFEPSFGIEKEWLKDPYHFGPAVTKTETKYGSNNCRVFAHCTLEWTPGGPKHHHGPE